MSDDKKPKRTRHPIQKIDFTKPFWGVFYQSDTTNNSRYFQGKGAEEQARLYASERANTLDRPVAILEPPKTVKVKPKEAADLELSGTVDNG